MSKLEVSVVDAKGEDEGIQAAEIPVGEVFFGEIAGVGGVFLKAYELVVCMQQPNLVWTAAHRGPKVYRYRPAESARLVAS